MRIGARSPRCRVVVAKIAAFIRPAGENPRGDRAQHQRPKSPGPRLGPFIAAKRNPSTEHAEVQPEADGDNDTEAGQQNNGDIQGLPLQRNC